MTAEGPSRPTPDRTARALAEQHARQAREAAALRANLNRRKAQARARQSAPDAAPTPPELPDSTDLS